MALGRGWTTGGPAPKRRSVVAVASIGLIVAGCAAALLAAQRAGPPAAGRAAPALSTPGLPPPPRGPFFSLVATARYRSVDLYPSPGGSRATGVLANPNPFGVRLVLLVRSEAGGWVQVWVPTRPNEQTAWVARSQVQLSGDPYAVVVNLAARSVSVWNAARVLLTAPAAIGQASTPTPTGTYFLAELLAQPDPTGPYGPYAFGLSAYSAVLHHFSGGPGQIGLHGTDDPGSIGRASSHGCVRVADTVISRLAGLLPLGTPVLIGNWS